VGVREASAKEVAQEILYRGEGQNGFVFVGGSGCVLCGMG
jgi:hypothetical protein